MYVAAQNWDLKFPIKHVHPCMGRSPRANGS